MIAIGFGAFAALVVAFTFIEGGAAGAGQLQFKTSGGTWESEEDEPADYRPNEPSEISVMMTRDAATP